jgi:hypothetical protein
LAAIEPREIKTLKWPSIDRRAHSLPIDMGGQYKQYPKLDTHYATSRQQIAETQKGQQLAKPLKFKAQQHRYQDAMIMHERARKEFDHTLLAAT